MAITKDDRVRRQIEEYLNELGLEDLRFATFKRVEEFEALYFRNSPPKEPATETPEGTAATTESSAEETELRLFSEVHMVIFALDTINGKSTPWIDKTRTQFKKFRHWPASNQIRFVLMKYEDDGIHKVDLLHPALDDLIYLPLDRLIFLQKMEILLAIPKLASPRFLFNQEVRHDIEISKITKLDRLSDVGIAIRNPVALKRGLPGRFYLQLPGEKTRLELRGKVIRSEPHPEYPGQFLVYFGFFGIGKASLTQIRRVLSKSPRYQSLISDDREVVRYVPDELFGTEATEHLFTVAVIDPDDISCQSLGQQLGKEMDRLQMVTQSSYSLFLHKYFSAGGSSKETPPDPTLDKDFHAPKVTLTVAASNFSCLAVDPAPAIESDKFLEHPAQALFADPEAWLALLKVKESRLIFEEAVQLAAKGRTIEKLLVLADQKGARRAVNFRIVKSPAAADAVQVEMAPAGLDDIMSKMTADDNSQRLDVMIVDLSFVPEDTVSWIQNLRTRALQLNLVKDPKDLRFMIVGESEPYNIEQWLENPDILGFFIKPVDTRQMLYFLSEALDNHNTLFHFHNLGWTSPAIPIHVAKHLHLEALSEFGATLKSPSKLAPGTVVYLRKSIYDNAPNACLAARVYYCVEHPNEKGFYQAYTTYFGINETFLKYARTWIRENYAQQKSQGGS